MAAFEVKYKYGEKLGMMIAVCDTQEEIPQCLAAAGVAGAEITSVRAPRMQLKF